MDKIKYDSPAALHHLNALQMIINRVAVNSATCKTWSIMLVSTAAYVYASTKEGRLILLAYGPLFLFFCLDCYYLGIERRFRADYKALAEKLRTEGLEPAELFEISARKAKDQWMATLGAMLSFSTWPIYGMLGILLLAVYGMMAVKCAGTP